MAGKTSTNTPVAADESADLENLLDAEDDLFADIDDLLNEVEEDDSEGWNPKEPGESVAGEIVKVDKTKSDFASDNDPDPYCPVWTIKTKSGDKYRVIGYGSVLKREMTDAEAQKGDLAAIKFFGEKPLKKGKFAGKMYKHFGVVVRHR